MRVLVTGGAGFIGSHLVEGLIDAGNDVYVLDNFSTGAMKNLSHVRRSRSLNVVRADIRKIPRSLSKRLGRVDRVCHLAAVTGVQWSIRNPIFTSEVNLIGTLKVLEVARKLRAERVVVASSAAVYGVPASLPFTEDANLIPTSPYGASKAASELYCRSFEENHGVEVVSLRYFNVYGPRQASGHYSGVISIFARNILRGLPLTIFGDGSQTRDFVFVADVVDATILALKTAPQNRVFNVASGTETTILQLARMMQQIVDPGASPDLRFEPSRQGDVHRGVADITRARTELGYVPATSLCDGLSRTIQWFVHKT